jgi:hypothetical protein
MRREVCRTTEALLRKDGLNERAQKTFLSQERMNELKSLGRIIVEIALIDRVCIWTLKGLLFSTYPLEEADYKAVFLVN